MVWFVALDTPLLRPRTCASTYAQLLASCAAPRYRHLCSARYKRRAGDRQRPEALVAPSFPLADLAQREDFLSLLHYFGLLSIAGPGWLRIPNQTVRELMRGYMRGAYRDVGVFAPDFVELDPLTRRMASQRT